MEWTPLLPRSIKIDLDEPPSEASDYSTNKKVGTYRSELGHLVDLAYPMIIMYLLEFGPGLITIALVGHINEDNKAFLDATALAVMFVNLTGFSIGFGLATALDTLASQAFGSSTKESATNEVEKKETARNRLSAYFQTGLVVLLLACIPTFVLSLNAVPILSGLGQPKEVAELAGKFVVFMLPGIPFIYLYELCRKILQAQNIVKPLVYVVLVGNMVNIVFGYILVFHSPLGWLGAAVARTCCNISMPLLLLPYLTWSGLINTFWAGWQLASAVKGMRTFLKLGIPGMLMLCFEWWAFEVITLICGVLPDAFVAMGANAVLMNISTVSFMFYFGLAEAANVRVGNALGAEDPVRARVASNLTIWIAAATGSVMAFFMLILRRVIPRSLSSDVDIDSLASQLMYIAAAFQLFDALNAATQGAFRGSGRQALGGKLTFLTYYAIGLPLGTVLALRFDMGLIGVWIAMTAGLCFISVVSMIIIYCTDWSRLAQDAVDRLHEAH